MTDQNWNGQRPSEGESAQSEQPTYGEGQPQYGQTSATAGGYSAAPTYAEADAYNTQTGSVTPPKPLLTAVNLMFVGAVLAVLEGVTRLFMKDQVRDAINKQNETLTGKNHLTSAQVDSAVNNTIWTWAIVGLILAGLWVLTALMNKKGKKWARIMATIFCVLAVLRFLTGIYGLIVGGTAATPWIMFVILALGTLVGVVAVVLLWNKENKPYYERMSAPRV